MLDTLTFALAFAAYVLLACRTVLWAAGRAWRPLTVALAASALAHVALVWVWRFEGSLSTALAKGLAGFVIFHTALALILIGAVLHEPWSGRCLALAFPIVTAGAVGAAFKYDVVAGYRIPLLVVLAATVLGGLLLRHRFTRTPSR
jgi:hypothetical protein